MKSILLLLLFSTLAYGGRPARFTELLKFVQPAPDQGETRTCLFMAATGAMEMIANKKFRIHNPQVNGPYDLAESYLIHAPEISQATNLYDSTVLKFNHGFGIPASAWPFAAWQQNEINMRVWEWRDYSNMPQVKLPPIETINLFVFRKHATHVLNDTDLEMIKQALWDHQAPVMINYVDDYFWHVALIVGYDDSLPGECYEIGPAECGDRKGSFYVRDSFGVPVEVRDYDWFRIKGNAAIVVKEKI